MRKIIFVIVIIQFSYGFAQNQNDSTKKKIDTINQSDSLSSSKNNTTLLPKNYMFTQKFLWAENGLMRKFDSFKLSELERDREIDIRSTMLTIHQYTGYFTLAAMLAEAYIGSGIKDYKGNKAELHETVAGVVNAGYFTTLSLALFAPPPMKDRASGWTSLNIHKTLAVVHFTGMIATNILGGMVKDDSKMKPYHMAAAITTFSALMTSMIVIQF